MTTEHRQPDDTDRRGQDRASSGRGFVPTRWTVVRRAARSDTTRARKALSELCRTYWYPLYAYIRRKGHSPTDAEDLTQAFFARVLEERFIAGADQAKGCFRSFLLTRLDHFLADAWDRAKAQKRGGNRIFVPLESGTAETRYQLEASDGQTPERLFEYRWVVTLLERVFEQLQAQYAAGGKAALFEELKGCLAQARAAVPYAEAGKRLGLSEGALRVAVHRLRRRYREVLRAEIADTVSSPAEVEEELRHLFRVLAG